MQALDVISFNLWQTIISLLNLLVIFLLAKKFLYAPIKKVLVSRQAEIDQRYNDADSALEEALQDKKTYEEMLSGAQDKADSMISSAVSMASAREQEIIDEAKRKADGIVRKAENDAKLELLKAQESIKQEIIGVSTVLTEKLLEREMNTDDHQKMIDALRKGDNRLASQLMFEHIQKSTQNYLYGANLQKD